MTLRDELRAVGREGFVRTKGIEMSVIIRDVRLNPYAVEYLIEPTAGKGQTWINGHQVTFVGWSE